MEQNENETKPAGGHSLSTDMLETAELERDMAYSERDDVKRAAAWLANALQDIFNDIGELPEVRARFESVYSDVRSYSGLERCGL